MQTNKGAVQPRAQLSTLPDELKTYIARLCAEQDEAIRNALADVRKRYGGGIGRKVLAEYVSEKESTVSGLYGTSKAWRKLVTPYRFKCLTGKQLNNERFRFDYVHKYGRFFTSLDLTASVGVYSYVHLAGVISLLPNIVRVEVSDYDYALNGARSTELRGSSLTPYALESARAAVERVLDAAIDITMITHSPDPLSHLGPPALDRLDRLSLDMTDPDLTELIAVLPSMRKLRVLELRLHDDVNSVDMYFDTALSKFWEDHRDTSVLPQLRTLKLEYPDISRTLLEFAELFAASLEDLSVHAVHYGFDFEVAARTSTTGFCEAFPALTNLTLSGDIDSLRGPLASISDDNFPALQHLRYLPNLTKAIPRISAYNLGGTLQQIRPEVDLPYTTWTASPPLHPNLLAHCSVRSRRSGNDELVLERDLRRTVDFLHDWKARAEAHGDTTSLFRMASALQRVELERIAHEA
ncbi:hypothetical protein JCM3774_005274 [Rhodotorula dairenensis]